MYILYGNIAGWKEIDRSEDELDIIDTLEKYIRYNNNNEKHGIDYFVVLSDSKKDSVIAVIKNIDNYIDYVSMARYNGLARRRNM